MKTCRKCGQEKTEIDFEIACAGYRRAVCKDCVKEARRKDYAERASEIAAARAELRNTDPEKRAAKLEYFRNYNRTRRIPDIEAQRIASKKWKDAHPEQARASHTNTRLKRTYGLTTADKERMSQEQGGGCAICSAEMKPACVDHCHTTGKIRALLCSHCNFAIGLLKDSPKLCFLAASYLQKFSS